MLGQGAATDLQQLHAIRPPPSTPTSPVQPRLATIREDQSWAAHAIQAVIHQGDKNEFPRETDCQSSQRRLEAGRRAPSSSALSSSWGPGWELVTASPRRGQAGLCGYYKEDLSDFRKPAVRKSGHEHTVRSIRVPGTLLCSLITPVEYISDFI